jgi:leucyl-tRNA synthetase
VPDALEDVCEYDWKTVEPRWQEAWREAGVSLTPELGPGASGSYVHAANPFTSGAAHLGHVRSYTIADAHARYRRARGERVLFTIGFDALGLPTEIEAQNRKMPPREWALECREKLREQFSSLGYSFDWQRSFLTTEEDIYRWSQRLFLLLLEHDLVYLSDATVDWCGTCQTVLARAQIEDERCWRCGSETELIAHRQWFLRTSRYLCEDEERLEERSEWSKSAMGSQRALLGKTEGVEIPATLVGGPSITTFTPYATSISDAAFVALSANHPDLKAICGSPALAEQLAHMRKGGWVRSDRHASEIPILETDLYASVPGVDRLLTVIVSPSVDARFGNTAILGIPLRDKTDEVIASRLRTAPAVRVREQKRQQEPTATVRYSAGDYPVSRQRAWGSPIPIVHCEECGVVPVAPDELPVKIPAALPSGCRSLADLPEFLVCTCPRCSLPAVREVDTLDCHFDSLWMWFAPCVPADERASDMFGSAGLKQWLPVAQVIWGVDGAAHLGSQRTVAKMLRDCGVFAHIPSGEPFDRVMFHDMVRQEGRKMSKHLGNTLTPDSLVERYGADSVRLAISYAAAPRNSVSWNDHDIEYCHAFLLHLWRYAPRRLRACEDTGPVAELAVTDKLQRRLLRWTETATWKVSNDLMALQTHRAARNAILLLSRIEDFERRATDQRCGELTDSDRALLGWALRRLLLLLHPISPHITEELWQLSGSDQLLARVRWPETQPVAATGSSAEPAAETSAERSRVG